MQTGGVTLWAPVLKSVHLAGVISNEVNVDESKLHLSCGLAYYMNQF